MTKQAFDNIFKEDTLPFISKAYEQDGIPDKPARREAYNNKLDQWCTDGDITEDQYNTWCITDHLESTDYGHWLHGEECSGY